MMPNFPLPISVLPSSPLNTLMKGCFDLSLINKRDQRVKGKIEMHEKGSALSVTV